MDKNQDVRRVFGRQFGCINKKKLVSGNLGKEKLGKEKVKRLSVVEREMDFASEDELHSTTAKTGKFKLPRKTFSGTNTSVPRKLRSAIRKRSCESPSGRLLDAKRSNQRANDVDLLKNDCLKKSKISTQNGCSEPSSKGAFSVTISKDEEEVAETLFALAGMISLNGIRVNNKTENESLGGKMSNLSSNHNSDPTPSHGGPVIPKEESETTNPGPTTNGSPKDSTTDAASFVWPKLPERKQPNLDCKVSVPPVHFQIPPLFRACDDKQLTNSTFCDSTEQNRESGCVLHSELHMFNDTEEGKSQLPMRESQINKVVADVGASQDKQHATSTHCRDNDLTSTALHGSGIDGLYVQSSTMIFPSWLDNSSPSKSSFFEDTPSASKAYGSTNGGSKSWSRCVAHVYISRLIQVLQTSEGKESQPSDASQLRPSQQSSAVPVADNRDDLNGTFAVGHTLGSAANDIHLQLKNGQAEEGRPALPGCCESKKQSCNFLSLSTGSGQEMNNGVNRSGITLEAKGQVLQLHSVTQQNNYAPNSVPQNHFPSVSFRDQVAGVSAPLPSMPPQVHLQVPPYFGNPCGPGHMATIRSTQQPQSKQQQQMWTAQLAAQFRPGPLLSSHIANWQTGTRDPRAMHHMQAHLQPPRPSPETIGSKYLHISQQQQQLLGLRPSLPTSNAKLQNSQLPSMCEDKGSRFHPDGVLPMQLLCNERLLS